MLNKFFKDDKKTLLINNHRERKFGNQFYKPCLILLTPITVIPLMVTVLQWSLFDEQQNQEKNAPATTTNAQWSRGCIKTEDLEDTDLFFQLVNNTEWRFKNTTLMQSNSNMPLLNCQDIFSITDSMKFLTAGWTKLVYQATLANRKVAIKLVNFEGQMMKNCKAELQSDQHCRQKIAKKFIKEIVALSQFKHPNIIELIGYCIPSNPSAEDSIGKLAIVSELGEPLNLFVLLQMNWEERLKILYSILKLLEYFSKQPVGAVVLNDLRAQQFVMCDKNLKLVDVDDVGLEEPTCHLQSDCNERLRKAGMENYNQIVQCIEGICHNSNDLTNIFNTAKHFLFLLQFGVPQALQDQISHLKESFQKQKMPSKLLRQFAQKLVHNYSTGQYFKANSSTAKFKRYKSADLPTLFDYPCHDSTTQNSCVLSVVNLQEAQSLCTAQTVCKAIVWTNQKTWTGRHLVLFKKNFTQPTYNPNTITFLKMDNTQSFSENTSQL
ncbi:Protein kinase domain-containing protein, cytoplasmic [Trichinella pseudospiralis]|nr:Protein kinase domain-containing protein, cytoplasmic [Trichinella pseudospiralis]KRY68667.1 Protein kinase domain-containing protein, cytoplasmic [Trichinella pseudospiralis]KRY90558.1 Protein kinase domain-containing protein, cytoplasmic [Trichinella pseudospiralis]KRZ26081.1 Protein kinase domain-containing protein, cytoplasmic [Trichinella pseudospiralis]KRZ36343.1 Protein kinase domain-containing protein, cytoplasmic [Trichinella pseudospiralis]